jgi:hypothetical protein
MIMRLALRSQQKPLFAGGTEADVRKSAGPPRPQATFSNQQRELIWTSRH